MIKKTLPMIRNSVPRLSRIDHLETSPKMKKRNFNLVTYLIR